MFNQSLSPQQRVDKAVIKIMGKDRYMALGGILMIGERLVVPHIEGWPWPDKPHTAATNGRDEWYCDKFIEDLPDVELRGLVLHESYHKMGRHLITWANLHKIDANLANRACDHWINIRITDECEQDGFAKIPEGGCCDFRFRGLNVMEIFNILRKEQQEQQKQNKSGKGDGQGTGITGDPSGEDSMDMHDWEGAKSLTDIEKKELTKEIDEAIRQGALAAGKSGTGGNRTVDELMEPQVDWREKLREFVASTCAGNDYSTWRMPSKRYIAGGLYMPRGISESVGELCLEVDMSRSTWNIVKYFMGEIKGICEQVRPEIVRVIYWDTTVAKEEVYKLDELDKLLDVTKPKGGGGTTIGCVPKYCNEHGIKPQAHIVLTDGYLGGDWGHGWNAPVLWCICDNKNALPKHGKIVHIDSSTIN